MAGPSLRPLLASAAPAVLVVAGCTFDFDAPFAGGEGGAASTGAAPSTGPGGGGAAGSSTTSQGGGPSADEDCGNATDDDDDGDVDCADATCSNGGWACAAAAPSGFLGPVALLRGSPDALPVCGGAFPERVIEGGVGEVDAAPATCTSCTCGAPEGATCTAQLQLFADPSCISSIATIDVSFTGAAGCEDIADAFALGAVATEPVLAGGACQPAGGDPSLPDARFDEIVALCAAPAGAGCDGAACLPAPEAPLEPRLCVYRVGGDGCADAGPYTDGLTLFQGLEDDRSCAPCVCGEPTGTTCGGDTTVFRNNDGCSGQSTTLAHDGACAELSQAQSYRSLLGPQGGGCAPTGGAPEGAARAIDPVTVCCLP